MSRLAALWQRRTPLLWPLLPLAALFLAVTTLRRALYRRGLLRSVRLPVPVVVVGNITVGGTGKTPLLIHLAGELVARGYRVGVVSRGYGGQGGPRPRQVTPESDPLADGDEPVLIARRCAVPVAVGVDRPAAAQLLVDAGCNLILSDDGLQHYRLARDVEIAVIDGERGLGNGWPLPAGPLREPPARLASVDAVVVNGTAQPGALAMTLVPGRLCRVSDPNDCRALAELAGSRVHAVAGIGHPARFFATLRRAGLTVVEHPFPDHHPFRAEEIRFGDAGVPVLMTAKDAVKCGSIAGPEHWYLEVTAQPDPKLVEQLLEALGS